MLGNAREVVSCVVDAVAGVPGVAAVVLGGSRARGTAGPSSDVDIGFYYDSRAPIDIASLRDAVGGVVDDPSATVTAIGEWGPWINGGGWLRVGGIEVDLLYRDLGKVAETIAELRAGRFTMDYQVGHPHGFCSAILAGEAAIGVPLHDPAHAFAMLKRRASPYPEALGDALVARFGWEVDFAIENGELAARRAERTHAAGCAYRALCCMAQVLFALNGRYLINEKGAVQAAAALPLTIGDFARDADMVWSEIGRGELGRALGRLGVLSKRLRTITAPR